ncbi:MAG: hypothetical protein BVN33_14740 [Proteobacteria bacterium ST_bin13]|nr:MAG: hypothetical protein BVN33_14740 [Proteobacteria bacterium ST_bin13]
MDDANKIAALVERCKEAERIISVLADDLGERGPPETKADAGTPEFEAWSADLGRWMQAMMEARVYFEVYDGPSTKAFDLQSM